MQQFLLFFFLLIVVNGFNFSILHTVNLQGTVLGVDNEGIPCPPATDINCFGGIARRQTYLDLIRAEGEVILLDVANSFVGSFFYYFFKGAVVSHFFNQMNYDAMSLGAFDFSNGPEALTAYLNLIDFPTMIVVSNINITRTDFLGEMRPGSSQKLIQPYAIIQRSGRKIAILSTLEDDIYQVSQPGDGLVLNYVQNDRIATLTAVVNTINITDPDCNIFILLTTNTMSTALTTSRSVPGIDVIIGLDDQGGPQLHINDWGDPVYYVGGGGPEWVGHTYVEFDDQGRLTFQNYSLDVLNGTKDNQTEMEVASNYSTLLAALGVTLVSAANSIFGEPGINPPDPYGCLHADCAVGWLITDALLSDCGDCDLALVDAVSIAHSLPKGNISFLDLLTTLPTQDSAKTYYLQGVDIVAALENSLNIQSRLQVGGIQFAWNPDPTLDISTRLPLVLVEGAAIAPTRYYKVVSSGVLREGELNYTMIPSDLIFPNDYLRSIIEIVSDYLTASSQQDGGVLNFQNKASFTPCIVNYTLSLDNTSNAFVWPETAANCRMIRTSGSAVAGFCPSNLSFCTQSYSFGDLAPTSPCSVCSGHGLCLRNLSTCQCYVATTGRFANKPMFTGDDCAQMRQQESYSIYLVAVMNAISCITIAAAIFASVAFFFHRKFPAFKAASPIFCQAAALGGGLLGISMLLLNITSDCMTWLWCAILGFDLLYGALLVKTYRIYKVFKPFSTADLLSDFTLLRRLVMLLVLEIGLMFLFHSTAPVTQQILIISDDPWVYWKICASDNWPMPLALGVYNGAILCSSAFVAYKVRLVWSKFNESKYLGISIYNTVFVALLGALVLVILGNNNPPGTRLFVCIGVNYVVTFAMVFLIYPKLRDHYRPPESNKIGAVIPPDQQLTGGTTSPRKYKPFRPNNNKNQRAPLPINSTMPSSHHPLDQSQVSISVSAEKGEDHAPHPSPRHSSQQQNPVQDRDEKIDSKESGVQEMKGKKSKGLKKLKKLLAFDLLHNYMGPEERLRKLEEVKSQLTTLLNSVEDQLQLETQRQRGDEHPEVESLRAAVSEVGVEHQQLYIPSDQPSDPSSDPHDPHPQHSHVATIQITELPPPTEIENHDAG